MKATGSEFFYYLLGAKKFDQYNGRIIRLTTNNDILNNASEFGGGIYPGEERITITNGMGHGMEAFKDFSTQDFLLRFLDQQNAMLAYDINKDGNIDVQIHNSSFTPKNLFSGADLNGCPSVKLDAPAFNALSGNIFSMVSDEMSWIISALNACIDANNRLKTAKASREDTLYENIKNSLTSAGLSSLIGSIDDSHGQLSNYYNKSTLQYLSNFNTNSMTSKFKKSEGNYKYTWYLNGSVLNTGDLKSLAGKVKQTSSELMYLINDSAGIFTPPIKLVYYHYNSVSKISESLVNVTNGFISKADEVFKGTGARVAFNDGIVQSIDEVLSIQKKNADEIKNALLSLGQMAKSVSANFTNVDKALSSQISSGSGGGFKVSSVPSSYKAYLDRSNIFDDVKDVLAAFDQQVEDASNKLAGDVIDSYSSPLQSVYLKFRDIGNDLETFRSALSDIDNTSAGSLKLKKERRHYDSPSMNNAKPEKPETTYLGSLSGYLPYEFMNQVRNAISNIVPLSNNFSTALYLSQQYKNNTYNLKNAFRSLIEKAVYESFELDGIIGAQNLIGSLVSTMQQELASVSSQISSQFKGNAFDKYQTHISAAIKLLSYFGGVISDCFGVKIDKAA